MRKWEVGREKGVMKIEREQSPDEINYRGVFWIVEFNSLIRRRFSGAKPNQSWGLWESAGEGTERGQRSNQPTNGTNANGKRFQKPEMEDESVVRFVSSWCGGRRGNGDRQRGWWFQMNGKLVCPNLDNFSFPAWDFPTLKPSAHRKIHSIIKRYIIRQPAKPQCSQFLPFIIHHKLLRKKGGYFFCIGYVFYSQLRSCYSLNIYLKSEKNILINRRM